MSFNKQMYFGLFRLCLTFINNDGDICHPDPGSKL